MSVNFSSGTTPMPNDTRWVLLVKILQSLNGGAVGGGGSGAVLQGSGAPSSAPSDPTSPALYTDTDTGTIYYWRVSDQTWQ